MAATHDKPLPIQDGTLFGADALYRILDDIYSAGVVGASDLTVQPYSGGARMSVEVLAGNALVNFASPYGGKRRIRKSATSDSGTPGAANTPDWETTFGNADATNPRIDRVVATVYDDGLDPSGKNVWVLRVVAGTPTGGANLTNLSGAAAVPNNSLLLGNVQIRAAATTIISSDIDTAQSTTVRTPARIGFGAAPGPAVAGATVAALGTGVAGRVGLITLTKSKLALLYDAVLGKWVSVEIQSVFDPPAGGAGGTYTTSQNIAYGTTPQLLWRELDAAGLKPQARVTANLASSVADGTSLEMRINYRATDLGGAPSTTEVVFHSATNAIQVTSPTMAGKLADSGWLDLAAGYTIKDLIRVGVAHQKTGGSGLSDPDHVSLFLRWVG
jgi:hypothetical protein